MLRSAHDQGIEHGLRCLLSTNGIGTLQILQSFAGATICCWIFDDFNKYGNLPDFSFLGKCDYPRDQEGDASWAFPFEKVR